MTDAAWRRFTDAEREMIGVRMALVATDWEPVVRRALSTADKETALRLLQFLPDERTVPFADALLPLALRSKPHVAIVRELLRSLGPGWMSADAHDFVEQTISSPDAHNVDDDVRVWLDAGGGITSRRCRQRPIRSARSRSSSANAIASSALSAT